MKHLIWKKAQIAALYYLAAIVVEMITFYALGFGRVLPTYFWIDLAFAFAVTLFVFAMPGFVAEAAVALVFLATQIVISCINEALVSMSGIIFSLNMLNLTKELGGVFNSDFVNWGLFYGLLLFFCAVAVVMIFLILRDKSDKQSKKNHIIILLLFVLLAQNGLTFANFCVNSLLNSSVLSFSDDKELWETQYLSKKAYYKFGFFGFYYVNLSNAFGDLFSSEEEEETSDLSSLDYYFTSGTNSADNYLSSYTGQLEGKNIVLVVIESGEWYAINEEYTPTLYAMANQGIAMTDYHARDKTNHSEALSVLGSYPTDSSIVPTFNDEGLLDHTFSFSLPNILRSEGYYTHYFHANDGDFYGRNQTFGDLYGFDDAHFLENMPALDGYTEKESFYNFDKDSEVIKNYIGDYTATTDEDDLFFTMHMTLTSHGNYEDLVNYGDYKYLSDEEREEFSSLCTVKNMEEYYDFIDGYPETFIEGTPAIDREGLSLLPEEDQEQTYLYYKRYQAGVCDLDVGINYLVSALQRSGELQNTAFIFYADHSAYYHNLNYLLKGVPMNESYNDMLYNIPFFIWCGESMNLQADAVPVSGYTSLSYTASNPYSGMRQEKNGKFCNTFDILPTVLQLEGFSYNENIYQGKSVFSTEESVFVSRESGIMQGDIYYDGITLYRREEDGYVAYDYEEMSIAGSFDEEMVSFLTDAEEYYFKQNYLEKMYASDYFGNRDIFSAFTFSNGLSLTYLTKIQP